MVPAAHANDGGGSIRIPAACCGLVGLKTSRGRVSVGPSSGEIARPLSVQFAVTRTVRDAAALLDVAAGPEPGDPFVAPAPSRSYRAEVGADPGSLRIGIMTTLPGSEENVHPDCVAAAEWAARLLETAGHKVEVAHPETLDNPERMSVHPDVVGDGRVEPRDLGSRSSGSSEGRRRAADVVAGAGRKVDAVAYAAALFSMQAFAPLHAMVGGGWDLLTPTLEPPPGSAC
jgi:amidase